MRGFDTTWGAGTTDSIELPFNTHNTLRTYHFWYRRQGAGGGNNGRILEKRVSGAQAELIWINDTGGELAYFRARATNSPSWFITEPSTAAQHVVTITYDAGDVANNPVFWVDGATPSVTEFGGAPSGAVQSNADNWVIGNRKNDNARWFDGEIGEVAIWDRILTNAEILALHRGVSPWRIPASLVSYVPLWGVHSSEPDLINGASTMTGTARRNHPPVSLFTRGGSVPLIEVAGGGSFAASMALAMGMTVAPLGKASAGAGLAMTSDVGMSDGAGAAALADVLAQSAATLTAVGKAGAVGAVSLALAGAITAAAKADTSAIIALTHDTAITALAQAVAIAGLDLTAAQSLIATAATQAQSAVELILTSAAALAASGQVTAASDVSLTLAGMLTQAAQAGAAGAITLNQDGSITVSGTKVVFVDWALAGDTTLAAQGAAGALGSLALSHDTAITAIAQAVTAAGFSLAAIQSLTITSSGVTAVLALPDGRTITISAETRILKVGAETRIFKA